MNLKTLKERMKDWLKSDFTKSLEQDEQEEREFASRALATAKSAGIEPLRESQRLFFPNKFYHKDLGVVEVSFDELLTLSSYLLREGKFNNTKK